MISISLDLILLTLDWMKHLKLKNRKTKYWEIFKNNLRSREKKEKEKKKDKAHDYIQQLLLQKNNVNEVSKTLSKSQVEISTL